MAKPGMLSAASRVWARAAALQAEEAVLTASPSLRPQIIEDPVVYRPPPAVPKPRAFVPPYKPPPAPPSSTATRSPPGPPHEHQEGKEQDEMWSDPRRVVEVEVFDDPAPAAATPTASSQEPRLAAKPDAVKRTTATSATVAALQKQADRIEADLDRGRPRTDVKVEPAPAPTAAATMAPTPAAALAATAAAPKKPFVFDPNADPASYLPQIEADPEDVGWLAIVKRLTHRYPSSCAHRLCRRRAWAVCSTTARSERRSRWARRERRFAAARAPAEAAACS